VKGFNTVALFAPIICDVELESELTWRVGRWGGAPGATLRLFSNDFEPDPETVLADFVEATYDGYAPVVLSGEFSTPSKVAMGFWESVTDIYTFAAPTVGPGNEIFGAYVLLAGEAVACRRFDAPITMAIGSTGFSLRLRVTSKSESLFFVFQE